MRGKDPDKAKYYPAAGITPAHAGKRKRISKFRQIAKDHPRACGEKLMTVLLRDLVLGSPPRMRGKVSSSQMTYFEGGITPAHAGKRPDESSTADRKKDHPRACGEKHGVYCGRRCI